MSAFCAELAVFRSLMRSSRSTNARFAFLASCVKRGMGLRESVWSNGVLWSIFEISLTQPPERDEADSEFHERASGRRLARRASRQLASLRWRNEGYKWSNEIYVSAAL